MKDFIKKNKFSIISAGIFISFCLLAYLAYKNGTFDSIDSFRAYVLSYGVWAFVIFFLANIMQVVVPGVPGGIILAFGVITFGPIKGFIYNYLSICIGSIINFLISKSFGKDLLITVFGNDKFDRYKEKIKNDSYEKFFAWAILLPVAPDDFLCYLTGLSDMSLKKFVKIILLCKPLPILTYSFGWYFGLDFIMSKLA